MRNDYDFIFVLAMMAFSAFGAGVLGWQLGSDSTRDEAVEAGATCYYVGANHQREFKWGSCDD